jgi:hypothetical protein
MKLKQFTKTGFLVLMGLSSAAFAGEGHDHGVPGAVAAPKGGEIKAGPGSYFELLKSGSTLKVYVYDEKLKPLNLATLTEVEATAKVPRGKAETVPVKSNTDHFETSYDPKKSHRFELTLKFKINGKADFVTFNVEKN